MGVYITGDIHGDPTRFSTDSFYEQKQFPGDKGENTVIILGDCGLVWDFIRNKQEEYWLDWLENKPFTTVFVDGNHENHKRLATYPIKEWHGGKVHEIRPHVLHLMRGEVFTIEDKKFFAFGGASSHDVQDGILDMNDPDFRKKMKALDKHGKYMYRIKGLSWWEEELPTDEEMDNGIDNLKKCGNKVDYIITHCASSSTAALISHGIYRPDELTRYFEEIRNKVDFSRWFMGHYHVNRAINDKEIILYEQIIRIL